MRLYAYIAAAVLLAAAGLYWRHLDAKAARVDAAEARAAAAEKQAADQAATYAASVKQFTEQQARDHQADVELGSRLTALEGAAAALSRAAARLPATVEKPDAQGVLRPSLNPDRWLCVSSEVSRDATDAAACRTRAGDGSVPDTVGR